MQNIYQARLIQALPAVQERIERARARAGQSGNVRIVAVTKGHPALAVRAAVAAGLRECGENRVVELEEKVEAVGRDAVRWHLIGHLQRNKVRKALPLFDLLHAVDSVRLARELSTEAGRSGVQVHGLVQVNASGETSKGGIDIHEGLQQGLDAVAEMLELPNLCLEGVMTMAPLVDDEAVLRATFRRTRNLFDACTEKLSGFSATHVSMGMTNDFETAVEEGSTMVRLGTILFGERTQ